jgi:hypothetical protein
MLHISCNTSRGTVTKRRPCQRARLESDMCNQASPQLGGGPSMRWTIAIIVALVWPSPCARAVETGAQAQLSCGRVASERLGDTIIEGAAAGHCTGMIGTVWVLGRYLQNDARFCIPSGMRPEQGTKIFLRYLANHPEALHEPDVFLAISAFREAWPCP